MPLVPKVNTFSICVAFRALGILGAATASRYVAVGPLVPHLRCGAGVLLTQSIANPAFSEPTFRLLEEGSSPQEVIDALLDSDEKPELRQLAVLSASGDGAAYTGDECVRECAVHREEGLIALGNMLGSRDVPAAMADAYREAMEAPTAELMSTSETPNGRADVSLCYSVAEALVNALAAGEQAGGDKRGKQAAAVRVHAPGCGYGGNGEVAVDLRVDDHVDPVRELDRILSLYVETHRGDPFDSHPKPNGESIRSGGTILENRRQL